MELYNMPQLRKTGSLCICGARGAQSRPDFCPPKPACQGRGHMGEGGGRGQRIYSSTTQGNEYRDQRESLPTLPRCGSLPKSMKWALLPACFLLEKANWKGSQLALSPSLWLGWALSESRFVQALPPCPPTQQKVPLLERKSCFERALKRAHKKSVR